LPREAAVNLLLDVTQQSDRKTAGVIAETLGDLPLAVTQAAAYMEATGLEKENIMVEQIGHVTGTKACEQGGRS